LIFGQNRRGTACCAQQTHSILAKISYNYIETLFGGDPASTWIAKPKGHAEDVAYLVNHAATKVIANDIVANDEIAVAA